jgi:hypothetical protein
MLTKVGAVALGLKSSYGFGANFQNLLAAINGTSAPSTGALVTDVTALASPGNTDALRVATIIDLSSDFALGRIGTNAAASRLGSIENFPSMQRVFVRDPTNLGPTIELFQGADVSRNLLNEIPWPVFQNPPMAPAPAPPASPSPTVHIDFTPRS